MKKVLVINGSPKGKTSNTFKLTETFLDGLQQADNLDLNIEIVDVNNLDLGPCKGCFACWNKTPGQCIHHDAMAAILPKLVEADLLIYSFPLYYFSVPGPLKTFFDRQLPLVKPFMVERSDGLDSGAHPSRYDRSHQRVVAISTCGFYTTRNNYTGVEAMLDHCFGQGGYYPLFCAQGELFRVPELKSQCDAYLEHVKQAGLEYGNGLANELKHPEEAISDSTKTALSKELLPRKTFEMLADASWGIEDSSPADGNSSASGQTATKQASGASIFTRQMAALYNPKSYPGQDQVMEMDYTDLGVRYQIVLGKEESSVITRPEDFLKADMIVSTPYTVWKQIAQDEIRGDEALMKGLYSVSGDPSILMNWGTYFSPDLEEPTSAAKAESSPSQNTSSADSSFTKGIQEHAAMSANKKSKWTNMLIFLLPWTFWWTLINNPPVVCVSGCLIGLALTWLLFSSYTKTMYDTLALVIVLGLCALYLMGISYEIVFTLSLLAFGVLWLYSCLPGRVPLCAWYSSGGFGRAEAFKNPIFMRTNWIIALGWGISYLVISAAAWIFLQAGQIEWARMCSYIIPALMGIFTAWFQRWYPRHVMTTGRKPA